MAEKKNKQQEEQPIPIKIEGIASKEEFITREEVVAKSYFDDQMKWLKERIGDINFVMGVVVIVLAVGFLTLLITVLGIVIQTWQFNGNIQAEMFKTTKEQTEVIRELKEEVKVLKESIQATNLKK